MYNLEIINKQLYVNNIKLLDVNYNDITLACYGFYGIIDLKSFRYLIVITKVKKHEQIFNKDVFEIESCQIIPLIDSKNVLFLKEINKFFRMPGMYYSNFSLYKNLQSKYKDLNTDFMFNYLPYNNALNYNLEPYLVKCIQGYYKSIQIEKLKICLISRRSWKRCGTRFFSRGLNNDGYPSNFVETEQILFNKNQYFSFLQIRGSIPLIWSHFIELKYAPNIISKIDNIFESSHIILKKKYSNILYLNLIKNEGYEGKLNIFFKKNIINKEHINIDFHKSDILKNKKKKENFLQLINKYIKNFTIRTNCIDCLDRTNYVQFLIGKNYMKLILPKKFVTFDKDINIILKKLWYENGNNLSIQYAGTPAIKSDIILTGRITFLGLLNDSINSIKRYFINRYSDGKKQSVYNILTGANFQLVKKQKLSKWNYIILELLMKYCVNIQTLFILLVYLIYILMIINLDIPIIL